MKGALVAVIGLLLFTLAPNLTASAETAPPIRLDVTKITPDAVTGGGPPVLTITGSITNTSDQRIVDLETRIQRGSAVSSEQNAAEAVRGDASVTQTAPRFFPITASLAPGQQVPFQVQVPISGGATTLQLSEPGVYPLMLSINGEMSSGRLSRLAQAPFLLPVLSPLGTPPARPPRPTPVTMLVPIVDVPRMDREPTPGQPAVLADDQMSTSLAPGGRLFGLVQAVDDTAPQGSPLGGGLCFAIDPDVVNTASAMQGGYQVHQPDGSTRPGVGAAAARLWLSKLRSVTQGRCVIALPTADADVVALGHAGLPDLIKGSMDGADVLRQALRVDPRRDVFWPIDGAVDEPTASTLADLGVSTLLVQPNAISGGSGGPARVILPGQNAGPQNGASTQKSIAASPIDPLLSSAAAGAGLPAVQNTLGALAFRATDGFHDGKQSVIAPARRWNIDGDDLHALLQGMQQLVTSGYLEPTGLPSNAPASSGTPGQGGSTTPGPGSGGGSAPGTVSSGAAGNAGSDRLPPVGLTYPAGDASAEIQRPVLREVAAQNYQVGDLFRAMREDPAAAVDPATITTPLRDGLLRATSGVWRGNPQGAQDWLHAGEEAVANIRDGVQVAEFDGQVKLTSSNSPIPLTVTNRLPVTVSIQLHTSNQPGIRTKDLGVLRIPAQGTRQFWLESDVTRVGKFSVDVSARTEGGTQLGGATRLQLESDANGTITMVMTSIAGLLLIVSAARRIIRRVQGRNGKPNSGADDSAAAGADRQELSAR